MCATLQFHSIKNEKKQVNVEIINPENMASLEMNRDFT